MSGARTVENTLAPYDNACWHLRMAGSQSGVMFMVHPLAAVRDAAQELQQAISAEAWNQNAVRHIVTRACPVSWGIVWPLNGIASNIYRYIVNQ